MLDNNNPVLIDYCSDARQLYNEYDREMYLRRRVPFISLEKKWKINKSIIFKCVRILAWCLNV